VASESVNPRSSIGITASVYMLNPDDRRARFPFKRERKNFLIHSRAEKLPAWWAE